MEENKIGLFIRDRRLELGLTQQQLADRLGLTDKAVSKWERCLSYPDITLLRDLAQALDVTATELLSGERDPRPVPQVQADSIVPDTAGCAEPPRRKKGRWRFWLFVFVTAGCLIAALVLGIVYFATRNVYVALALKCVAFAWAVCCPLLGWERYPVAGSLTVLSCAIVPFLAQFGPFGAWVYWIALLSVGYLWAVYLLCKRLLRRRMWIAAGWSLLLGGFLALGICQIVRSFTGIDMDFLGVRINLLTAALCAGVCFLIDFFLRRRSAEA